MQHDASFPPARQSRELRCCDDAPLAHLYPLACCCRRRSSNIRFILKPAHSPTSSDTQSSSAGSGPAHRSHSVCSSFPTNAVELPTHTHTLVLNPLFSSAGEWWGSRASAAWCSTAAQQTSSTKPICCHQHTPASPPQRLQGQSPNLAPPALAVLPSSAPAQQLVRGCEWWGIGRAATNCACCAGNHHLLCWPSSPCLLLLLALFHQKACPAANPPYPLPSASVTLTGDGPRLSEGGGQDVLAVSDDADWEPPRKTPRTTSKRARTLSKAQVGVSGCVVPVSCLLLVGLSQGRRGGTG